MKQLSTPVVRAAVVLCLLPLAFASCPKAVDFNAYFMHNAKDNFQNRIDDVAKALRDTDADVMCLQEVWLESSMASLLSLLRDKYPYHFSYLHFDQQNIRKPGSAMGWVEYIKFRLAVFSSCSATDAFKLTRSFLPCVYRAGCMDGDSSLFKCAVDNCAAQIKSMNADCISCLGLMQGGGARGMYYGCMPNPSNRLNKMNAPGLMMLSKKPMTDLYYRDFWPGKDMIVKRGYIAANVPEIGRVVCTHLTALFDEYMEYDLTKGSNLAQQAEEINHLIDAFGEDDHLLMGDLNTGPIDTADKNSPGEGPENFKLLMGAGYTAPYLDQDGRCTYCANNPLTNTRSNHVIDHMLVKGNMVTLKAVERIIDEVEPAALSDHYGIKANVCPSR